MVRFSFVKQFDSNPQLFIINADTCFSPLKEIYTTVQT